MTILIQNASTYGKTARVSVREDYDAGAASPSGFRTRRLLNPRQMHNSKRRGSNLRCRKKQWRVTDATSYTAS
ncbi:hypothetical protein GCM10007937_10670 [Mesorhizobium albiziae]|nr:hypothetical protein GCM10007937_10670 [Mesorhizobium albiziae]